MSTVATPYLAIVENDPGFRATLERRQESWQTWPQPMRGGVLSQGAYDSGVKEYHQYVQWCSQPAGHHLRHRHPTPHQAQHHYVRTAAVVGQVVGQRLARRRAVLVTRAHGSSLPRGAGLDTSRPSCYGPLHQ
jgi:hypothetical protein